jgi:hypothetical protein
MTVIPHPPYSPDLALCDFFLFPKMTFKLKRNYFINTEEIQTESQDAIMTLTFNDFQQCFRSWKSHWDLCINAERATSKGENRNFSTWFSCCRQISGTFE